MIKLSVIIVNYNVSHFLEQCLISVYAACKNVSTEIIVVDNDSKDGSCSMVKDRFPTVRLIENHENIGFSKANNIGVEQAKGTFVLILNPDTVIAEDTLQKVLYFAEIQEDVGAIGVRFIDGTGNFLPECKRNIPTIEIASRKLVGDSKRYYAGHVNEKDIAEVEVLTGAFMLLKRETYKKVGGFDEDYFMFGEDIDLSYKLVNQGLKNYYFGETTIIHYKGESTNKDKTYLENFYGAMHIFYEKHFKSNIVHGWILKKALKALVLLKNVQDDSDKSSNSNLNNIFILGEDLEKNRRLQLKLNKRHVESSSELPKEISAFDQVIFDNDWISFKEIIRFMQKLKSENISFRIIPAGTSFFIGSDSSKDRGDIVQF